MFPSSTSKYTNLSISIVPEKMKNNSNILKNMINIPVIKNN